MLEPESLPMTFSARNSLIAIAVLWFLFALTIVFRVLGRIRGIGLGLDDILSIIALVLSTSTIGLNATVFNSGVGYDFNPTSPVFPQLAHNLPYIMQGRRNGAANKSTSAHYHLLQIASAFTLIYIWALAALKLSQLALYMRVFSLQLRNWVYAVGAIVMLWALIFNFLFVFLCDPIAQQWTVDRIGHCMDQILLLKCLIMTNLVTDLFIVILPIRPVWQLQMRKTEKFAVLACFGLGLACVIISLARFIQIYTIDLVGNLTGTSLTTFMLCTVELLLAGICINIPMLRPFYLRWRAQYKSSHMSGSGQQGNLKITPLRTGDLAPVQQRPGLYTAWIELNDTVSVHSTRLFSQRAPWHPNKHLQK